MKSALLQLPLLICILIFISSCDTAIVEGTQNHTSSSPTNPTKEVVMENLARPWSIAFLSETEALLAEKEGDILRINLESKSRKAITGFPKDLADSLTINLSNYPIGTYPRGADGFRGKYNAGIFEILLDPNFASNQWVYISYVSEKEQKYATKVIRAKLKDDALTEIETLLIALPYADGLFHFGGGMVFGGDGKLYITIGERLFGDSLQPDLPIAQNYQDQRGKIYRINPDGSIPEDSFDFGTESVPGIYAIGIRAAQGLTKDPKSGRIWFSEHGTTQGDELNILEGGANYGWPIISTGGYRGGYVPPKLDRIFKDPMWSWYKTVAPTGLTFYTGSEFPEWKNNLIVSGLSKGNLWRFVIDKESIISVEELFINNRHRTRKVVQSPGGKLYILTDEINGKLIRIKNG